MSRTSAILIIILLVFFQTNTSSQTFLPDTVNKKPVTELQTIQTTSNTFISALMVDPPGGAGSGYHDRSLYIYRSTDNGGNWDSVFFYGGGNGFYATVDPVITVDSVGNIFVVAMRSYPTNNSFNAHLWTFKSSDNGLTWVTYTNTYTGNDLADYPSITALGNNLLFLSYTIYTTDSSYITFKRSNNGGTTWTNINTFNTFTTTHQYLAGMGSNLAWTMNSKLCLSFGDNTFPYVSYTSSLDSGKTWLPLQSIPMPTTAAFINTKIISSKNFNHIGIIANHPHDQSYVYYLTSIDGGNTWSNQTLSNKGAYGDGLIDNSGHVHLLYNESLAGGSGQLSYRYSTNNGQTFCNAIPLFNWPTTVFSKGEYQSLLLGSDGLLHATYVDWHDGDKGKHLVFAPLLNSIHSVSPNSKAPKVYPIPATDQLIIECITPGEKMRFTLMDLSGKIVLSGKINTSKKTIDISTMEKGIYILQINNGQLTYIQKVLKE